MRVVTTGRTTEGVTVGGKEGTDGKEDGTEEGEIETDSVAKDTGGLEARGRPRPRDFTGDANMGGAEDGVTTVSRNKSGTETVAAGTELDTSAEPLDKGGDPAGTTDT